MSKDNVVKLELVEVGEAFKFEADQILEAALGELDTVLIIGTKADGSGMWVSASVNAGVSMILMEKAKHQICELGE
jgi:hypothetical protein